MNKSTRVKISFFIFLALISPSIILLCEILKQTYNVPINKQPSEGAEGTEDTTIFDMINTSSYNEYIWPLIEKTNYTSQILLDINEKLQFINGTLEEYYNTASLLVMNKSVVGIILLNDMYDEMRIVRRGLVAYEVGDYKTLDVAYIHACVIHNRLNNISLYVQLTKDLLGEPNISIDLLTEVYNETQTLISYKTDLTFNNLGDLKRLLLHTLYLMSLKYEEFGNITVPEDISLIEMEFLTLLNKTESDIYLRALLYDVLVYMKYLAEEGIHVYSDEISNYEYMLLVFHKWFKLTSVYKFFNSEMTK